MLPSGDREDSTPTSGIFDEKDLVRYEALHTLAAGARVLEAPCRQSGAAALQGARAFVGLDNSHDALAQGRKQFPAVAFVAGAMQSVPFASASFDLVLSFHGIELLFRSEVEPFLAEVRRVLAPGGKFAGTVTLLGGGKHSGNPSHLCEYTEANIRTLLGRYFESLEASIREDAGLPVLFFVGVRRAVLLADEASVEDPVETPSRWLEKARREAGFASAHGDDATLLGTCLAVLLLESCGELSRQAGGDKARWGDFILSAQQHDGSFADSRAVAPETQDGGVACIEKERSHFVLHALDALRLTPRRPMEWLDALFQPGAIDRWLESLDWSDIPRASECATGVLAAMAYRADRERRVECATVVHDALDWLERKQDPVTGFWGHRRSPAALVATARVVALLEHAWRPVKASDAIIDSTLRLQRADSRFGSGSNLTPDLAATALLATMSKYTRHRSAEVRRALVRDYWAVGNAQPSESDSTSSVLARTLALGIVGAALPGDVPPCSCAPLSWPGLGYFRTNDGLPPARREDVRVWLRSGFVDSRKPSASVTLVITCYNLGRYLHEAIASVLDQTVLPDRIVVVDDGSTEDFTNLLLDNWPYVGIELVRQRNAGVSAARNNAIREAGTEFVCSMDADDRLRREYLEKAVARIGQNERIGYVSCHYQLFDCGSGVYRYNNTRLPDMLVRNETCGISVFRKRAWEAAGGYCETLVTGLEDWDLWIGILEAGYEGAVIPEILFDYRIRPGSRNTEAVAPAKYEQACRIVAGRHQGAYGRFAVEVAALSARQFIEVATVRSAESENATRVIDALTVQLEAEQAAGRALDSGRRWLEHQVEQWERAAEEMQAELARGRAQVAELVESRVQLARHARPGPVGRALRTLALFASRSAVGRARNVLLWMKLRRDRELSRRWDDLFDAEWYARMYPDVEAHGVNAALHYLTVGHMEGRRPSPRFDARGGSQPHSEVLPRGANPLVHAILYAERGPSGQETETSR